ncbi:MAG: hypothetical protein K2W95_11010 [Candidatus Obscuribacterales bacterium]|nr:hypothetical protein [Candidatus Obscuribacterales bacterium]
MNRLLSKICTALALASFIAPSFCGDALADNYRYQGGVSKSRVPEQTFLQRHPVVKRTAVGAAVGTAAGAGVGLISGRGGWRGAGIGAATGAGVGLIRSSKTLKRHPVASKVAQGSAVGLGVGLAASRGHGTGKRTAVATGIGAAVGLGAGLLKNELQ